MPVTDNDKSQKAIACRYEQIAVALEPLDVDERTGGVELGIDVSFKGACQSLHWAHRTWVLYSALNAFEEALRARRPAILIDMSRYPILQVMAASWRVSLVLNPTSGSQSADGERLTVQLGAEPGLVAALADAFRTFPKWW